MKTTINTLLATVAITLNASASPALLAETTITGPGATGGKKVLAAPRILVESGKQGIVQVATEPERSIEYAVTPILLADGIVEVRAIVTEHRANGGKKVLAAPRILVESGKQAVIQGSTEPERSIECAVTPTLLADGIVELRAIITEQRANEGKEVWAASRITVESGKQGIVQVATQPERSIEYAVTPTLLADGIVELGAILTQAQRKEG